MKKALPILLCSLLFLTVFYPFGRFISSRFGYIFRLVNISVFAVSIAAVSVISIIIDLCFKNSGGKSVCIISAILTPLSLINAVFFIVETETLITLCVLVSSACCFFFAVKYAEPISVKIISLMFSAILVAPIAFFAFFSFLFGDLSFVTVVKTVESPSGQYCAQVIDSDQGALGGSTAVVVSESIVRNAIFIIEKQPKRVYSGRWGEFFDMKIYWKDDGCLVINSAEYKIE